MEVEDEGQGMQHGELKRDEQPASAHGRRHCRHARAGQAARRPVGNPTPEQRYHFEGGASAELSFLMGKLRILVADDHEVVRRGIRALLETRSEWEICGEASTGRDAIAKTARLKPDVVLLDITMPDMSGLDAIPEILKACPETKILVLTMHDSGRWRPGSWPPAPAAWC